MSWGTGDGAEVAEADQPVAARGNRKQLEDALGNVHQDLADLYRHAVCYLEGVERNRAVVVMISHAVREIANNLAHHLGRVEGVSVPPSVDTSKPLRELERLWHAEGSLPSSSSDTGSDELAEGPDESIRENPPVRISKQVYRAVQAVVAANSEASGSAQRRRAFVAVGESATPHDPTVALLGNVYKFFMGRAHLDRAAERGLPEEAELQDQFTKFETIISGRLTGFFFNVGDELADVLGEANAKTPPKWGSPDLGRDVQ